MPERGYNAELNKWTAEQADVLNSELVRPHPSYWTSDASLTGAITTITTKVDKIPADAEVTQICSEYGTGTYGVTDILIVPLVTYYDIVAPNQLRIFAQFGVLDTTGAYPVPGGAGTAMLYYCYADFISAGFAVTTAPKVRYAINLKAEVR